MISWFTGKKIWIYLKELWQECEEGWKSVFKKMEDTSKESEIISGY